MLASLFLYVRMRRTGASPWLWVPILASAALCLRGKVNVALPAVAWALEVGLIDRAAGPGRACVRALPFAALVGLFFSDTRLVLGYSDPGPTSPRPAPVHSTTSADQLRLHRGPLPLALPLALEHGPVPGPRGRLVA